MHAPESGAAPPGDWFPASAEGVLELTALSESERRVLALALAGLTVHEIAERLALVESTAREQLARVYGKLGVSGRTELAARVAAAAGRDDPPPERTEDDPDPRPASELPAVIAVVIGLAFAVLVSVLYLYATIVTGPLLMYAGWRLRQGRRSSAFAFAALWVLLVGVVLSVFAVALLLLILLGISGATVEGG